MENSGVKIGARILSNAAMSKLLPSSSNIMGQIESIREIAKTIINNNSIKNNWDKEFDRHYNNIFSILGGRGSGKTSVLLTMKYNIMKEFSDDFVLPLIVPEKMGQTSDVLGSVLGFFGDEVAKIEKTIYKNQSTHYEKSLGFQSYFINCRKNNDNPLRSKYNELLKQYSYTQPDYRKIILAQYEGFSDYIENSKHTLDSEHKLILKFEEFIEELISIKLYIQNINCKQTKRMPLIFLFFDDVDLSTERCAEVLNVILRYLSHPNLVVFVAGNYSTFSEVLTINALQKDGLIDKEILHQCFFSEAFNENRSALDVRKDFTQDLLRKVLPPTFRYQMPKMDEKAKAEFIFSTEKDNDEANNKDQTANQAKVEYYHLYELIIKNFIDPQYKYGDYGNLKFRNNFLHFNNELIYAYFKIFDDTQRGTMNLYHFLYSIMNKKLDTTLLKRFLQTTVQSSSTLSKYENDIVRIIDIRDTFENTFIDYSYIENMLNKMLNKDKEDNFHNLDKALEDLIVIFILAHFIENIIVIAEKRLSGNIRRLHGSEVLYNILNCKNRTYTLFPRIDNVKTLLQMYTLVSMNISNTNIENISENQGYFLGKYFEIIKQLTKKGDIRSFFQGIWLEDKVWCQQKIKTILNYGDKDHKLLRDNIESIFKRVTKMNLGESILLEIAEDLNEFNIEGINAKNLNRFLQSSELKDKFLDDLFEVYDDKFLDFEEMFKYSPKIYMLTDEIKEVFFDILNNVDERTRNFLFKFKETFETIDYLSQTEYDALRRFSNNNRHKRIYERIYYLLRNLKSVIPVFAFPEINSQELMETVINLIKTKTLMEIEDRKNKYENFYNLFSFLKTKLLIENRDYNHFNNSFSKFIQRTEEKIRQVNLNV